MHNTDDGGRAMDDEDEGKKKDEDGTLMRRPLMIQCSPVREMVTAAETLLIRVVVDGRWSPSRHR